MSTSDERIAGARLDLVLLRPGTMRRLLHGERAQAEAAIGAAVPAFWPDEEDRWVLALRLGQVETDPASEPWLLRAMVERASAQMVGHVGFHGPPDACGRVEIGYSTFAGQRRRGYAYEAAMAMAAWARARGARTLVASVSPQNAASLALVRKAGMRQTGRQWEERDGEELVFELPLLTPRAGSTG